MSFASFGLSDAIVRAVYAAGHATPTEVQSKAIPPAVQGRDLIGCAPTGTGKTAAFVLPILHQLLKPSPYIRRGHEPRALVLTPTRELAQQVEETVRMYGTYTQLRSVCLYGGVAINPQLTALRRGAEIVVATPGRLLDHAHRYSINLTGIEVLVLDEADKMYDMGFIHDVRKIVGMVPKDRQTLLFSATMSKEIRSLVAGIQRNPQYVDVGVPCRPVETVEQKFYSVPQPTKLNLLVHILQKEPVETMLVFSRTKHGADKIAKRLGYCGVSTAAIHSDRSQSQRQKALEGFKRRQYQVLVATDLAARGIDVDGISHVVNYDTPVYAEDYVHRIGRTGRAQAAGTAFTFVSRDEEKYFKKIELLTGKRLELKQYPGFSGPDLSSVGIRESDLKPSQHQYQPNWGRRRRFN